MARGQTLVEEQGISGFRSVFRHQKNTKLDPRANPENVGEGPEVRWSTQNGISWNLKKGFSVSRIMNIIDIIMEVWIFRPKSLKMMEFSV